MSVGDFDGAGLTVAETLRARREQIGTLRLVVLEASAGKDAAVIARQRRELLEIATPVLKLWDGVLAVPLIAQTIAALGIDLGEIRTRGTLADALAWALRHIDAQART